MVEMSNDLVPATAAADGTEVTIAGRAAGLTPEERALDVMQQLAPALRVDDADDTSVAMTISPDGAVNLVYRSYRRPRART
jgi:hypothetical protein